MKVINYKNADGNRVGLLIKTLRKYHYLLLIDNPFRVQKVPLSEERYFRDAVYKGRPYPVSRAKKHMKRMIKSWHGGMKNVSKEVKEVFKLPDGE